MRRSFAKTLVALAALFISSRATAQNSAGFGTCVPRSQHAGKDPGCFIITEEPIGQLDSARAFWHVVRFATRDAALAARPEHGTVIDAFDATWLMVIGDAKWRSKSGSEVATIGPLPIVSGTSYAALYMEATMTPGMKSAIHRHSGPEAWYTLSGETCLETPSGSSVGRAGGPPVIIPGGPPMQLTATGTTLRRSLVLILHDARHPPTSMETEWKPRGLCHA